MLTEVRAGEWTFRGVSVGGVYTTILVPELSILLDAGIPLRSLGGFDDLFISHGHVDHLGGLMSMLAVRTFLRDTPARIYVPAEIVAPLRRSMEASCAVVPCDHHYELIGLCPGDERELHDDWFVRAFRTHHSVPSLGYLFLRHVRKLRAGFEELSGREIADRRASGDHSMLELIGRPEIAYAADSLATVLETTPEVLEARVLVLECSFIGGERSTEDAHARTHIHLEDILERADQFRNEEIVLMHFSQVHEPEEVHRIVSSCLPASLRDRVRVFAPEAGHWFG